MIKGFLTLLWSIVFFYHGYAQIHILDSASTIQQVMNMSDLEPWKVVKQEDDITLKYRWLKIGGELKTRALSIHFTSETHTDTLLSYLVNTEKHNEWNKGIKAFNILAKDSTNLNWITHTKYDIPFPISQQDLVVNNVLMVSDSLLIIDITSKPNYIPSLEDSDRIKHYIAQWKVYPIDSNTIDVTFSAITLSKSYIPRFIKDPIIQNNFIKSFKALKKSLEFSNH